MHTISKQGSEFQISNYPWNQNDYMPKTTVTISYDKTGFFLHFVSWEKEILAKRTEHNSDIYRDSCMEFFVQFDPVNDLHYINFEINPNGAVYNSISLCREESVLIDSGEFSQFQVKTQIFDDRWEITYHIPISYIQKHIPSYQHHAGAVLRANFYKCGDDTKYPHFGCFSNITLPEPDFHCPQFFTEFELV